MDDARRPNKKTPYRRKMTDKRRDQNRAAQKTYRAKRKERLELLERQVTALQQEDQDSDHLRDPQEPSVVPSQGEPAVSGSKSQAPGTGVTSSSSSSNNSSINALKQLLKAHDDEKVEDMAELLDFALEEQPNINKILLAGLRALKSKKDGAFDSQEMVQFRPEAWPMISLEVPNVAPILPDPLAGGIFLRRQSALEVCYHNCRQIGLRFEEMTRPGCPSPWFSPLPARPSAIVPLDKVPPDLYPTPAQIQFPHHPFMDIIPFPWLRERAITLMSLDPPPYEWFELKADILTGGMICWRSRASEEGLPWDRRSWEVKPWFWKKWSWLIEEQGKVEQQSRWWRAVRGAPGEQRC